MKEAVYTYTVTNNKLVYVQDYDLFIRDLDGKNKTKLLGQDDNSTVLFSLAGDWIVSRSTSDAVAAKTTLIKLDGTKPAVEF